MHLQERDPIGTINRWKAVATLVVTGYGLLVCGALMLDGWIKKRRRARDEAEE